MEGNLAQTKNVVSEDFYWLLNTLFAFIWKRIPLDDFYFYVNV